MEMINNPATKKKFSLWNDKMIQNDNLDRDMLYNEVYESGNTTAMRVTFIVLCDEIILTDETLEYIWHIA